MKWRHVPNLEEVSFEALRQKCIEGSEEARREFIRRFDPLVWRAVRARLDRAPREDQEEVVANTFIALLSDNAALLARYDASLGASPAGYIHRQAVMQSINRYRLLATAKRRREVPLEPAGDAPGPGLVTPDPHPDPEQLLSDVVERRQLLERFKQQLTPALALTFELLWVRELDHAEAARALGCSMEVIYTRKKRIHEALEAALKAGRPPRAADA